MAYVDFSRDTFRVDSVAGRLALPASEVGRFTSDEIRVIELAERFDAEREASPRSRLARFAEWVFGLRTDRPLANGRLERLRRFASIAFHHPDHLRDDDFGDLLAAGYSHAQAIGLIDHLARRRLRRG